MIDTTVIDRLVVAVGDALEAEVTRRSEASLDPLDRHGREALAIKVIREELHSIDTDRLERGTARLTPTVERTIVDRVIAQVLGLGPVEHLLADESVEEITASRWDRVHVYRSDGSVELLNERLWSSERELATWLAQLARTKGRTERRFNPGSPLLVMRLGSGLRLAAHRDVSQHVGFALRRNTLGRITLDRLGELAMMPPEIVQLLQAVVRVGGIRLVFAGPTSSGKSTTARACLAELHPLAHVIVIEDTAELDLFDEVRHPNVESWEQRDANAEGEGTITQGQLVAHALRARPDWLVCGEVRDSDAAVPMVKAMTQGQASLTTVHAPSATAALDKLALYLGTGEDRLPIDIAHHQLSLAVDLVVQLAQLDDGHRIVTEVVQVAGYDGARCTTNQLYRAAGPASAADGVVSGESRMRGQGFARATPELAAKLASVGFDIATLGRVGMAAA